MTYIVGGSEYEWHAEKNIKITGNPVTTPGGVVGLTAGLTALTSIVILGKSLAAPATRNHRLNRFFWRSQKVIDKISKVLYYMTDTISITDI